MKSNDTNLMGNFTYGQNKVISMGISCWFRKVMLCFYKPNVFHSIWVSLFMKINPWFRTDKSIGERLILLHDLPLVLLDTCGTQFLIDYNMQGVNRHSYL